MPAKRLREVEGGLPCPSDCDAVVVGGEALLDEEPLEATRISTTASTAAPPTAAAINRRRFRCIAPRMPDRRRLSIRTSPQ